MELKLCWAVTATILSIAAIGCDAPEEADIDAAEQPQIGIGYLDWRRIEINFANDDPFAVILVIGDQSIGAYDKETEYWYVDTSYLSNLGSEDLVVSYSDGNGTPASESGDQEFTQANFQTWNSFSSDPVSGGYLYDSGNRHLRVKVDSNRITQVTWYQTLSSGSPANFMLDSDPSAGSGSVTVPSGQTGYYVDATIN